MFTWILEVLLHYQTQRGHENTWPLWPLYRYEYPNKVILLKGNTFIVVRYQISRANRIGVVIDYCQSTKDFSPYIIVVVPKSVVVSGDVYVKDRV